MVRRRNPGLVVHHDPRNERYLLADSIPKLARSKASGPTEWKPRTRRHRQYRRYDQGNTPRCTGYGSATYCAAANPFNVPPISPDEWYRLNQQWDRGQGMYFPEGATVNAALEVGRAIGVFSEYRWGYTMRTLFDAIAIAPLMAGTWWYPSMFDRTPEGIVHMPSARERPVGGHLFTVNGYDVRRDLWRVPNTWGDGDYFFPGELMFRLLREEGEFAQVTEIKLPKRRAIAA